MEYLYACLEMTAMHVRGWERTLHAFTGRTRMDTKVRRHENNGDVPTITHVMAW